ncbi:hypothetical protein ASE14_08170 [Agromyces sp. Root81]|uniref:hypothetical protein n=1 Tax=Agromyces sp. Root81 TaxID=1736601 RepID=UPI0007017F0B|nr:hypothetical protein [Agromyces sp. Root81]KRC60926.1 hypothetical protein ASE14_08170 [Agromyces sp. Root81]
MTTPDTTSPKHAADEPISYELAPVAYAELAPVAYAELAPELLPLNVRRVLYLLGIAALVAGPVVAVQMPEYGTAIISAGNMLGAVGLGTALANPRR